MSTIITQGPVIYAVDAPETIDGNIVTVTATVALSQVKQLRREACLLLIDGEEYEARLAEATTEDRSNDLIREFTLTFLVPGLAVAESPVEEEAADEELEVEKPKRRRKKADEDEA